MPRKSTGAYPPNWAEIAKAVKDAANWTCVRCGQEHSGRMDGNGLTVHHLDLNPANCEWWNLPALCQRCHLQIQHKVDLNRPWVMADHSAWFKPYAGGYFAWKYLGKQVSREEVEANLDYYVNLERTAVLL